MIKYVAGGLWLSGVLLTIADSIVVRVHGFFLFGMGCLTMISLYNYFLG